MTGEALQRIDALAGGPIGDDLVRAVLDWFRADEQEAEPTSNLLPLAVDVALRLHAAAKSKDALAIAAHIGPWLERRRYAFTVGPRMRTRIQALSELGKLAPLVPVPVLAALARIVAIDDWFAYDRELKQLDDEAHDQVMDAIATHAPTLAGLQRQPPPRPREKRASAPPPPPPRPRSRRPPPPAIRTAPPPAFPGSSSPPLFGRWMLWSLFFSLLRACVR